MKMGIYKKTKKKMKEFRWAKFFTPKDYENLKYKHLSRADYRTFIIKINERKAHKEVVLNKDGYEMPLNFGLIQIRKKFMPGGVNVMYKKTKEYNMHSLGYVYSPKCYKKFRSVYYSHFYEKDNSSKAHHKVRHDFYKFIPHRANIKRAITPIIRKQIIDYHDA